MRLPVVPLYALSLGADTVQVGIINSAFLLMAGLLSLPLGILSDRFGRKRLACLGVLILSATSYLLYFSTTPMQMVWIYLFFGIGLAAFGPTMMSLVADISPPTHLGRSYGWYTTALYTSMSLGPAVGGFVAKELGFLQVFLISGTLIFITFWLIVFFLPRARLVVSSTQKKDKWSAAAGELMQNRPLLGCWLVTVGGCFGLGMFVTFLPLHAQNQGLHVGQIGIVFAVQGISNALSRIPFGHLSDKVAKRGSLVVIGLLGFVGSMVGFAISGSVGHFIIFAAALGISMGLAFTSVGALIAEVVPPESRGLAMGGYNTCIYFGMMLSSALMGPVIEVIGFEGGFHITALINFLFIGFFYLFMKGFSLTRVEQ
jgi:MFS family permease